MLAGGERVLVAVSGGADSLALLHCLIQLRERLDLTLFVAHVHHGLRPEAEAEAAAVAAVGAAWGVPVSVERVAVRARTAARAGEGWAGPEGEARRARFAALAARARALDATRIALGHTADDQAETVVMRLLEGAGPLGLGGIPPVRGRYVRPLIDARRPEVEAHLRAAGVRWAEDASNRDPVYVRNRVRHDVLPFLAERWAPDAVAALCRGAAVARAAAGALAAHAGAELERLGGPDGGGLRLSVPGLLALPPEVAAEALRLAVARRQPDRALRGPARRALARLLDDPRRRAVRLGGALVERSGRWLRIGAGPLVPIRPRQWRPPGRLVLVEAELALTARLLEPALGWTPPRSPDRVAFDAAALPEDLVVRARRPGDRLVPFGSREPRRVKSVLADAGVPRWERERVPILEGAGEILWLAGVRRSAVAPVTASTRCILEVTVSAR